MSVLTYHEAKAEAMQSCANEWNSWNERQRSMWVMLHENVPNSVLQLTDKLWEDLPAYHQNALFIDWVDSRP